MTAAALTPAWLDRSAYPFASKWMALPDGRIHWPHEEAPDAVLAALRAFLET